jgi:hypothetical protein
MRVCVQVMTHLMLGKPEKVMLEKYFPDLWNLFHPKLSEPSISVHPNKQVGAHSKLKGIASPHEYFFNVFKIKSIPVFSNPDFDVTNYGSFFLYIDGFLSLWPNNCFNPFNLCILVPVLNLHILSFKDL